MRGRERVNTHAHAHTHTHTHIHTQKKTFFLKKEANIPRANVVNARDVDPDTLLLLQLQLELDGRGQSGGQGASTRHGDVAWDDLQRMNGEGG